MRATLAMGMILVMGGCTREPGSTVLTKGTLTVECDEAVAPVMQAEVAAFQQQYPDAKVNIRVVEAREAIADFANDSVRVIVTARALNDEERTALGKGKKVEFTEYHVAQTAIAVIADRRSSVKKMRMGELDSIFSGAIPFWPMSGKHTVIDLVVGGVNSSTNEVFREIVLKGKGFGASATPVASSSELVAYVQRHPQALGIVGVAWLRGISDELTVMSLGTPGVAPDSTEPPGQYYSPAQAYVFKKYYPISTPVYLYSREVDRDISLGFIAFVSSAEGQKVIQKAGLVPVTMPVRLVQLTSDQVK
jgi:phosphate transport system substrate-binding protein